MPTIFESPAPPKKAAKGPFKPVARPNHHLGPFSSFMINPSDVRFETQQSDETVILFLRQHFIVNLPWIIISLILILSPTFVFPFMLKFLQLPVAIPVRYVIVGTLFWYLATIGFILTNFLKWFFNIYIVTNERIVDIDFVYLLYKQFSETRLASIQDLTYKTSGIFATIFNFGSVFIQTAGERPNFEFIAIAQPDKVVQTISELSEEAKKNI